MLDIKKIIDERKRGYAMCAAMRWSNSEVAIKAVNDADNYCRR